MQQAKALERTPGVLSTSLFFVGSYLDVPDMGCSSLVVTDGDPRQAMQGARVLARDFWGKRHAFAVRSLSVAEAVARGREIEGGPVLLLDTADTTGGGASGDGVGAVKGLLAARVTELCLAMVVDPAAVQVCLRQGIAREVLLELGHKLDPRWGTSLRVTGTVLRGLDGRFRYSGGILGGSWASMGPSVVLQVGSIQILIMSNPTYDWADEQYRAAGLSPEQAKFVCVKNMMNFRFGYRDIMKGFFVVDVPGPTPADMRSLPFRRIERPVYPLDDNLTDPVIRESVSRVA
jgi:microcystin degradation protein MlrC